MSKRTGTQRGLHGITCALAMVGSACASQPFVECPQTGLVCRLGFECSPAGDFCVLRRGCGNGDVDPGEACDDGNRVSGDGCSMDCLSMEACGNAIRDVNETCDDGNTMDGDGCNATCQLEGCGNGETDSRYESCDDGNNRSGDGCSADCLSVEICGNGYIDISRGELCDDGNTESGDGCSADCRRDEHCGNGYVDAGEICDDGGNDSGDGCSADCRSDERCGNGIRDSAAGEDCDDGNRVNNDGCDAACHSEVCGNGTVEPGEECDDGNRVDSDGCSPDCRSDESCGNGILDPRERCDDNNTIGGDGCSANCLSTELCGNGYVDYATEECDDGMETQYCNYDCTISWCGDGYLNQAAGEECDDANAADMDGCRPDCTSECTVDDNSNYLICWPQVSWYVARDACASMSAKLVIINDMVENTYIAGISSGGKHWIGLSDQDRDGTWLWVDGAALIYESWHPTAPNGGTGSDCVEINFGTAGLWNNLSCSIQRPFVCER